MKTRTLAAACLPVLLSGLAGCNSSSLSGGSGRRDEAKDQPKQETEQPQDEKEGEPSLDQTDGNAGDTGSGSESGSGSGSDEATNTGSGSDETVTPTDEPVKPDDIVDGMEVIKDCKRCTERAKQLSAQAGFTADPAMTYNCGYYKIPPAQGLCDIHFMADMRTMIADHEGEDSVLDGQVALYCPCDCGWAETTAPFDGYPPYDP